MRGYFAAASDYREFEKSLVDRGFPTLTVPLSQRDWLPTFGGRWMVPILRKLDRTVKQMLQQYGSQQIDLVCHSAGGWISRIYLGEKPHTIHGDVLEDIGLSNPRSTVNTLISLGTQQVSVECWTRKNQIFSIATTIRGFFTRRWATCALLLRLFLASAV
ncbi:esterase/lipase family protein [Microcoleus sp. LEGE 07076]|uniref:esterase/lipase family protein n=1 Tax=Microcoleus sp. LEGE 07076 TaxID=915322 RepID=UPI0030DA9857